MDAGSGQRPAWVRRPVWTTIVRSVGVPAVATLALAASAAPASAQQFGPARLFPAGDGIRALALADFDGDGHRDVLLRQAPAHLGLAHGDGRGGLDRVTRPAGPALDEVGDLDGDGVPDLLGAVVDEGGGDPRIAARVADHHGGFGEPVASPAGLPAQRVLDLGVGDVDGDGTADVVVAVEAQGAGAELWVALGRGEGRLAAPSRAGSSPGTQHLVVLPDLDGDGHAEVALAGDGAAFVHGSDAQGSFGAAVAHRVGERGDELGALVVGRFAPGAPPALAVANRSQGCIALVDPTAPPTSVRCAPAAAGQVQGLAAGDVDGDGLSDLVHGLAGAAVGLLPARGGALGEPQLVPLGALTNLSTDPLVGDLDEDGRPDVVAVANLRSLAVLLNVGHAHVALSATRLTFGARRIRGRGAHRQVVVRNEGTFAATDLTARVAGPASRDFALVADRCRGGVLAPGATCALRVRFRPRARGPRAATLVLEAPAPGLPREVTLLGWGLGRP